MSDPLLAIRALLSADGSAVAAERQLHELALREGDAVLSTLVAELTPAEVATFLEESDYTKPSTIVPFLTPEQFLQAFTNVGSGWSKFSRQDSLEALLRVKEELFDFLLPVLLLHEKRKEILHTLLEDDPLGEDVLVCLPLFEQNYRQTLRQFEASSTQSGTWEELFGELWEQDRKTFLRLRERILDLGATKNEDDDEEEEEEESEREDGTPTTQPALNFLRRTLQALADRAKTSDNRKEARPEENFFGI